MSVTVPAGFARPVAAGARSVRRDEEAVATDWEVLQSQQTEFGLVELRYAVFGKGRARVRSWKIFCEGFQVNYGAIESDAWVNYERAVKGDFRDRPECPAGDACTGAPFPGHPGLTVSVMVATGHVPAAGHRRTVRTEMEIEMSEHGRQIMFVVDGGIGDAHMELGTVADLAERLRCAHYSDAYEVTEVYGLNQLNELKSLVWKIDGGGDYDEDQWAHVTLTVMFPGGDREQAYYRIDGRA